MRPSATLELTVVSLKQKVVSMERDVKDLISAVEQLSVGLQTVAASQEKPKFGVPMPATESASFKQAIRDADMYLDRVRRRAPLKSEPR